MCGSVILNFSGAAEGLEMPIFLRKVESSAPLLFVFPEGNQIRLLHISHWMLWVGIFRSVAALRWCNSERSILFGSTVAVWHAGSCSHHQRDQPFCSHRWVQDWDGKLFISFVKQLYEKWEVLTCKMLVRKSEEKLLVRRLRKIIIGVCILSRVYQLNIRTPPYATNVSACFIVHSLHCMRHYNQAST
jgi:hypothetical protein